VYDTRQDLLAAMRAVPDILTALLAGYSPPLAAASPGGAAAWSVVEVVCHLRDADARALERMRQMRDSDDPWLAAYDQDAWAREQDYAAADLPAALRAFGQGRAQYLAELATLALAAWERPGRHAEEGRITIQTHTLHQVAHSNEHLAQIARLRAAAG